MGLYKGYRNTAEIEHVGNAVRESAYDEQRHSEKKRKIMSLSSELDCSRHDESTADGKKRATERSHLKSEFHDLLRRRL